MLQINSNTNFSEVSITSMKGQVLYECITTEKAVRIPVNLHNGIYLIQINGQSPNTLIIQND